MFSLLISLLTAVVFVFNINAFQLHDSAKNIVNTTLPKSEDVIIAQEGGDISREILYPTQKDNADDSPFINAASALVIDAETGLVLFDKDSITKHPIASITKLMTILVFLDLQEQNPESLAWENLIEFKREDFRGGRRYLGIGEKVTIKDLFSASLIGSNNSTIASLVHATGLIEEDFVEKMNEKADELDMINTQFSEPTGLDANNISTVRDLAKLVYVAMQNQLITNTLSQSNYFLYPVNKKVTHKIYNTNWLLNDDWFSENNYRFIGGKTGYTNEAGYNFVSEIEDENGNKLISAILNTDTVDRRFEETKKIVKWSFNNYEFPPRVQEVN